MEPDAILSLEIRPFFDYVQTIRYGYQDRRGTLHLAEEPDFAIQDYIFSSPEEVIANSCGWCWDVANLISVYCTRRGIEHQTVFLEYHTHQLHQTHTQVFLKWNNMWYPAPDNSAAFSFGDGGCADLAACCGAYADAFRTWLREVLGDRFDGSQLLVKPISVPIPAHISDDAYLALVRNC